MSKEHIIDWEEELMDKSYGQHMPGPAPVGRLRDWMEVVAVVTGDGSYFSFESAELEGLLRLVQRETLEAALQVIEDEGVDGPRLTAAILALLPPTKTGEALSRPTDLTPELADKLCQLVEEGLPMSRAAEHEGIDYSTLKRWQRRKGDPYEGFSASLKRAKAASQAASIRTIRMGAQGWQGEAWYLERSDPKNWGRRMEVKTEAKPPKDPEALTEEQLVAKAKQLIAKHEEDNRKEVH